MILYTRTPRIKSTLNILFFFLFFTSKIFCATPEKPKELVIIGGGIAGAMETYYAHCDAQKSNIPLRVSIYDKNSSFSHTTVFNIAPSLTPDEILSVVPRGQDLVTKLQIPFYEPGGIRVDDVSGISGTSPTEQFKDAVQHYSLDELGHKQRSQCLLAMGKMSMDLWHTLYATADTELKKILEASNFNPCCELTDNTKALHKGYRIDLIYNVPNAHERAMNMKHDYEALGYTHCAILSPDEVKTIDPYLASFCNKHSSKNADGIRTWHTDTVALWRPGGCLDTQTFLPQFSAYLRKKMGTFTNAQGQQQDCLQITFNKKVTQLEYTTNASGKCHITAMHFEDGTSFKTDPAFDTQFVFCPGEAVGTLKNLGLHEPAYAGFAGASLRLVIDIPQEKIKDYEMFNHCMEVHQEGVVLAWQARLKDSKISIVVAGTKAFYSDQKPTKDQAFAKNRNLLQLNMINDVLPEFISMALKRDTAGKTITSDDLHYLESQGIATRWAGTRAVVYDGFPTLGPVYHNGQQVINARCTTHLGSGGVSFSPAAVVISQSTMQQEKNNSQLMHDVARYANSARTHQPATV